MSKPKYPRYAESVEELVSDEELNAVWGHANFGGMTKREVIALGTLKCLSGWAQGHTGKVICQQLGLITEKYTVTAKGRAYLWLAFGAHTEF